MSAARPRPRSLVVAFADGQAFLRAYRHLDDTAAIYVREHDDLLEGQRLDLRLDFDEGAMVFHARGTVLERSTVRPHQRKGSALVELDIDEKLRDLIVGYAQGRRDPSLRKRARGRLRVRIPVEYTEDRVFHAGVTEDLSRDGAAVHAGAGLPRGPLVALRFRRPLEDALTINAEVVWRRNEPPAFGVRFLLADDAKRRRLEQLIDSVAAAQGEPAGGR